MLNLDRTYRGKFSDYPLILRDITVAVPAESYAGVAHNAILEFARQNLNPDHFTVEQFHVTKVFQNSDGITKNLTFHLAIRPEINEPNISHVVDSLVTKILQIQFIEG